MEQEHHRTNRVGIAPTAKRNPFDVLRISREELRVLPLDRARRLITATGNALLLIYHPDKPTGDQRIANEIIDALNALKLSDAVFESCRKEYLTGELHLKLLENQFREIEREKKGALNREEDITNAYMQHLSAICARKKSELTIFNAAPCRIRITHPQFDEAVCNAEPNKTSKEGAENIYTIMNKVSKEGYRSILHIDQTGAITEEVKGQKIKRLERRLVGTIKDGLYHNWIGQHSGAPLLTGPIVTEKTVDPYPKPQLNREDFKKHILRLSPYLHSGWCLISTEVDPDTKDQFFILEGTIGHEGSRATPYERAKAQ